MGGELHRESGAAGKGLDDAAGFVRRAVVGHDHLELPLDAALERQPPTARHRCQGLW